MDKKLKLQEFKILFSRFQQGVPWIDHLILGLLVWLEEIVINACVENAVDQALQEYVDTVESDVVSLPEPVYSEKPSEGSTSLPEMRLTAPWYKERVE